MWVSERRMPSLWVACIYYFSDQGNLCNWSSVTFFFGLKEALTFVASPPCLPLHFSCKFSLFPLPYCTFIINYEGEEICMLNFVMCNLCVIPTHSATACCRGFLSGSCHRAREQASCSRHPWEPAGTHQGWATSTFSCPLNPSHSFLTWPILLPGAFIYAHLLKLAPWHTEVPSLCRYTKLLGPQI